MRSIKLSYSSDVFGLILAARQNAAKAVFEVRDFFLGSKKSVSEAQLPLLVRVSESSGRNGTGDPEAKTNSAH